MTPSPRVITAPPIGRARPVQLLLAACLAAVGGCGDAGDGAPQDEGATVAMTDSAGVRIVRSEAPAWSGPDEAWRVEPDPVVDIGNDPADSTQHLFAVAGVRRLSDGRLAVGDAGLSQIRFFDAEGRFLHGVGRDGEGPGEFSGIRAVFRCGGDTLMVADRDRRLQVFTDTGAFVRTETVVPHLQDRPLGIEGVSSDCASVLARGLDVGPDSNYRVTLHWSDMRSATRDTVATFPWLATFTLPDGPMALPYGAWAHWVTADRGVYVSGGKAPEVRAYDRGGRLTRIVRWSERGQPITEADRLRFERRRERLLRENPTRADVPDPDDFVYPERKPLVAGMLVDDEGNLWARPYPPDAPGFVHLMEPERGRPPEVWRVFDGEGRWLGRVEMPADLEVMDVHGGLVVGLWRDDLDVQHVRLHRIARTGS